MAPATAKAAALEAVETSNVETLDESVDEATHKADPQFAELSPIERAHHHTLAGL